MDHPAFECARCGVHLPLKRDLAADDQWVCANCGWPMPGVFDPNARESIGDNVLPVPPDLDADAPTFPMTDLLVALRRREYPSASESSLTGLLRDNS